MQLKPSCLLYWLVQQMNKEKKTRGPGRPRGITKIHYNCRLPRDIVAWLQARKNGGRLIEQALRNYYNLPDKDGMCQNGKKH